MKTTLNAHRLLSMVYSRNNARLRLSGMRDTGVPYLSRTGIDKVTGNIAFIWETRKGGKNGIVYKTMISFPEFPEPINAECKEDIELQEMYEIARKGDYIF